MAFKLPAGRASTDAAEWEQPAARDWKPAIAASFCESVVPELVHVSDTARSLPWVRNAVHRSSSMNEAPDDGAQRAQPEKDGGRGLNPKASPAFIGGLRIAGHVKNAAGDPDEAQHRRDCVADVDREQPERGQQNRHPFQRVYLHANNPLEIATGRDGRAA